MSRRRILLLGLAVAGLTAGLMAARPHLTRAVSSDEQVSAEPGERVFDFYADRPAVLLGKDDTLTFDVSVSNPTSEVVRFGLVGCSCACTAGDLSGRTLDPGQTTSLRLAVQVGFRRGPQRFGCQWSDDKGRTWAAGVRVMLVRPEEFDTSQLAFGTVEPGQRVNRVVHFRQNAPSVGALPPLPAFSTSAPSLTATPGIPSVTDGPNGVVCRNTPVEVVLTGPDRTGECSERVVAAAAWSPGVPTVSVSWAIERPVSVSPAQILLFGDSPGRRQRVWIRATDGKPFKIVKAGVSKPGVSVNVTGSGESAAHTLEAGLDGESPPMEAEVVVETTHPAAPKLVIPIRVVVLRQDGGGDAP